MKNISNLLIVLMLSSCITSQTRYTNHHNIIDKSTLKSLTKDNKKNKLTKDKLFSTLGFPDKETQNNGINTYTYYLKESKVKIPGELFYEEIKEVTFQFSI